jgi:hypothetical protein
VAARPGSGSTLRTCTPIWRRARGKTADLSVHKFFDIKEQMRVESGGQFFNAFNHPVFSPSDAFITDGPGSAGVITSTVIPQRQIQFALKLEF